MKKFFLLCMVGCCGTAMNTMAQGLTDMSHSQQALMQNTPMGTVKWTGGFWGDRFNLEHSLRDD